MKPNYYKSAPVGSVLRVPSGLDVWVLKPGYADWQGLTTTEDLMCLVLSIPSYEPVNVGMRWLVKCLTSQGDIVGVLSVETLSFLQQGVRPCQMWTD